MLARPLRHGARSGLLCLVADGVGGRPHGAAAARAAVRSAALAFAEAPADADPGALLRAATQTAHQAVREHAAAPDGGAGGATTLVAALLRRDGLWIANVGDSRAYLLEPDGALLLLTHDHSWAQEQVREGALSPEQAAGHPWRRVVTRCLGTETPPDADLFQRAAPPGARVLLCSDGLRDVVDDGELARTLARSAGPEDAVAALLDLADLRQASDDVTLCVAELAEPAAELRPRLPWRRAVWAPLGALALAAVLALLTTVWAIGSERLAGGAGWAAPSGADAAGAAGAGLRGGEGQP